jgi:hypothetical protein
MDLAPAATAGRTVPADGRAASHSAGEGLPMEFIDCEVVRLAANRNSLLSTPILLDETIVHG